MLVTWTAGTLKTAVKHIKQGYRYHYLVTIEFLKQGPSHEYP